MYKYTGEGEAGWSQLNVMNGTMNGGPGPPPLWAAVHIFQSSPGAGLKCNFMFYDMCFLLSDRTPRSLRRISSTMSPSRADCRTEWAAGWPEPTSCTAEPAGSTFRSWPTRGWTQTATMEPCMVRTTIQWSIKMFNYLNHPYRTGQLISARNAHYIARVLHNAPQRLKNCVNCIF